MNAAAPTGEALRVLIVDDNQDTGVLLSRVLERMGCETRVSSSGEEGLDTGTMFAPDLVLLDLGMPHMNGVEICRRMRQQAWGQSARIVACTAYPPYAPYAITEANGFDGYVLKPASKDKLHELIQQARSTAGQVRL